jgi:zinc transporter ZupT
LLLITIWAALEGLAIAVLQGSNRFSPGQALTLAILVMLATGVGIVCYITYYRLNEITRFWNGLIPLIVDAGVMIVFLVMLALS